MPITKKKYVEHYVKTHYKLLKTSDEKKILKVAREKSTLHRETRKVIANFSCEIIQTEEDGVPS